MTPAPAILSPGAPQTARALVQELVLTAGALVTIGVAPNILVAAGAGLAPMSLLARMILIPALVLFTVISLLAAARFPRLWNRLWVGIVAGVASTVALDVIRYSGFRLGAMPGDMPRMFGVMLLDRMALGPSLASDLVGYAYHFVNGIAFAVTYTLVFGRTRWWVAVLYTVFFVEIGMMVTPPMVKLMATGYFGLAWREGPLGAFSILTVSVLAHIAEGVVLGLMAQRFVRASGTVFSLVALAARGR